ncbi:hypothetical protein INR49_017764 [Caranx melampygus]|nr:hypothetical protein INR49_017764 [Caranx melampygus]
MHGTSCYYSMAISRMLSPRCLGDRKPPLETDGAGSIPPQQRLRVLFTVCRGKGKGRLLMLYAVFCR